MKSFVPKLLAGAICAIAFAFGIVRVGVGLALMSQVSGLIDIAAFREPVAEVQQFLREMNDQAYLPLSSIAYLAIIAFMGVCLVLGAVGSWNRKNWGYGALSVYLLTHAGLFANFQTINPKINILIAGIILLIMLLFLNRLRRT